MVKSVASLILALSFLSLSAFAESDSALLIKDLNTYPDGIIAPRSDVPLTTYNTAYSNELSLQQKQLEAIYQKIFGLNQLSSADYISRAREIFLLENEIALFLQNIPAQKVNSFERESLSYRGIQAYKLLRASAEHVFDNTLRLIDIAIPGPGGPQIRSVTNRKYALYAPNYRSDVPLSATDQQRAFAEKLQSFLSEGNSLSEITTFTNEGDVPKTIGLSTFEFIQSPSGEIRFTSGSAGHLLLSNGQQVRSAGTFAIVRDMNQKIVLLVVSNSSGTFKPDILSAEQTAKKLSKLLKVNSDRVVVTRGEPFGLQTLKILLKADYTPKEKIKQETEKLTSAVRSSTSELYGLLCKEIFVK